MVFSDRKFIVVCDPTESIAKHDALCALITANHGEIVKWDERADVDVSPKLVIVSSTMDYERAEEMKRFMIPTVIPRWVHFCVREQKLVPTRPFSPDPRNFMRDVIACFSGLSQGDTDVFKAAVAAAGGEFTDFVTRFTTHVVATSLDTPECELVRESRRNNPQVGIRLVLPSWLDACMSLQIKVDDTPYMLENDDSGAATGGGSTTTGGGSTTTTAGGTTTTTTAGSGSTQNLTGTYPLSDSPRLAVQQSVSTGLGSNTLDGRAFFLAADLDLSTRVFKTVTYLIETNGGTLTTSVETAHVFLGKWREGSDYIAALRRKIIIGNITWLYWVLIHQHFEKPTHLLHYPEVRGGLPAAKAFNICVTNYTGDARAYLQSLIQSLGANYSGKLIENHTTHLITAYESGQKFEAAKKWSIPVVNHLWLEDSYAYWQPQDPQSRIYTYFPSKLSMSTLIGSRNLVHNVLQRFMDPNAEFSRPPHPKRQAKQRAGNWLHDAMIVEGEFQQQLRRKRLPLVEDAGVTNSANDEGSAAAAADTSAADTSAANTSSAADTSAANTSAADTTNNTSANTSTGKTSTGNTTAGNSKKSIPASSSKPRKHRIMFSGVEDLPSTKACAKIGLSVVKTNPVEILVAPKFMKTAKFLQCLAHTEEFVTPGWVSACIAANTLLPTDRYRISDPSLSLALENRAALNGKPLFEGVLFKLAPDCRDQTQSFKAFIKAHGGEIAPNSARDLEHTATTAAAAAVVVVGNKDPNHLPWAKLIECMQRMDPSVLSNNTLVSTKENERPTPQHQDL